jgi:hypothetical protein
MRPSVVVQDYNPSTWKVEARGYRAPDHYGLEEALSPISRQ